MKKNQRQNKVIKEKNFIEVEQTTYKIIEERKKDANFFKLWLDFEFIRYNEMTLLLYFIKNMSNKNICYVAINEYAKKFKVTRQTISTHIKNLQNKGWLIWKKPNFIFINPERAYKGNAYKRDIAINAYIEKKYDY